jgi:hypothetical protein
MALLSQAAIALLARFPETWTEAKSIELDEADPVFLELRREGLVEGRIWPPPRLDRHKLSRVSKEIEDRRVKHRYEVKRTPRGALRLLRIRDARKRG